MVQPKSDRPPAPLAQVPPAARATIEQRHPGRRYGKVDAQTELEGLPVVAAHCGGWSPEGIALAGLACQGVMGPSGCGWIGASSPMELSFQDPPSDTK